MFRLLKAEMFKLYKSRTFKVLCVIACLMSIMSISMVKLMSSEDFIKASLKGMSPQAQNQYIQQMKEQFSKNDSKIQVGRIGTTFQGKDMFHPKAKDMFNTSFGSGLIEILLLVLIGSIVAGEYSKGTIKNMLAYGKKREYYYIAKLLAISVGAIGLIAVMILVTTVGSSLIIPWGQTFDFSQLIYMVKVFFVTVIIAMAIASLGMLLATLVKSNGTTIGIGIPVFVILPMLISFLYGKFDWFDKIYECTLSYNWSAVTSISATNGDMLKGIIVGIITLVCGTWLGIGVLKKQDIK